MQVSRAILAVDEQTAHPKNAIRSKIQLRTSSKFGCEESILDGFCMIKPETEVTQDMVDLANCLLFMQELLEAVDQREEARPDGFHEEDILLLRQIDQDFRFLRVKGRRLLDEDALSGIHGIASDFEVVGMRRADIHDLHLGIVVYLGIRTACLGALLV